MFYTVLHAVIILGAFENSKTSTLVTLYCVKPNYFVALLFLFSTVAFSLTIMNYAVDKGDPTKKRRVERSRKYVHSEILSVCIYIYI